MKTFAYYLTTILLKFTKPMAKILEVMNVTMTVIKTVTGFKPRADDIFLATYPKSGTTWLQMIMFQLTSDGDLDKIPHLSKVIPHLEESQRGEPQDLESLPRPRIFKTHLLYHQLPRGGKVIYVMRDGMDVANSYYHHHQSIKGYQKTFAQFFETFLSGKQIAYGSWFEHMASWLSQRDQPHILFLRFEDMKRDLEGTIAKIIDFCDLKIDPKDMPRILQRCSFQYMKEHQDKLDLVTLRMMKLGLTPNHMVREGKTGQGDKRLDEQQKAAFNQAFAAHLKAFDLGDYDKAKAQDVAATT